MEEIYKKWEAAEEEQLTGSENKKRKVEMGKASAEEARIRAAEKLSATNKGNNTEEVKPKKARRRGGEPYNSSVKNLKGIIKFTKNSFAWDRKNMMMRIMQQQNNSLMPLMSKSVNK